jgi:hypothetical protein
VEDSRFSRLLIGIGVAAALAVACQPSGTTQPSSPPSVTPISSPATSEPVADCESESTHEAGALAFRLEHYLDIGLDWVISVYEDGRILTPGITPYELSTETWMLVRRLTAGGVDSLLSEVEATGLFETTASYNPVPLPGVEPPGHGASGFSITVSGKDPVVVTWTSVFDDEPTYYQPSPEREALDELAAHLVDMDIWLPDDAWAWREPCPYRATTFGVIVVNPEPWGGSLADLPADIADVEWPPGGDILTWADPFDQAGTDPEVDGRCGTMPRAEAGGLVTDLAAAGAEVYGSAYDIDLGQPVTLRLGYRAETSFVDVLVRPLLPDESSCVAPSLAPFGI